MTPRTLAAGAALVLLLAGCTDDPKPRYADPTTDAPTTEPTTEPTPPPTSTPTPEPDPLSPEETVRAWVKALNTMALTGKSARFLGLSAVSCRQCKELETSITAIYEAGGHTRSRGWTIAQIGRAEDFRRTGLVPAAIKAARSVTIDKPGADPRIVPADKFIIDFTVVRQSPAVWTIQNLDFLS